jgi:hypothetical protein
MYCTFLKCVESIALFTCLWLCTCYSQEYGKPRKRSTNWAALQERVIASAPPDWKQAFLKASVHAMNRRGNEEPDLDSIEKTGGGPLRHILTSVTMNSELNQATIELATNFENGVLFSSKAKSAGKATKNVHRDAVTGEILLSEFHFQLIRINFSKLPEEDVLELFNDMNQGRRTFESAKMVGLTIIVCILFDMLRMQRCPQKMLSNFSIASDLLNCI